MTNTNDAHPVELLLLAGLVVAESLLTLLVAAAALALLLARWRPRASAAQAPATAPHTPLPGPALAPAAVPATRTAPAAVTQPGDPLSPDQVMPELATLTVAQLRCLARELHLPRCLSHTGRRADLLLALPMAW
jgi:hypothetical protein